jgi:DNA invertase Pin-like site-specific DNA recombinase
MLVGYTRVSTSDQSPGLQEDALKQAGCEKLFHDSASGAKTDRPGLAQALEYVREGDVLVVWRLDRLGRSLVDLLQIVSQIEKRGIGFKSLTESIDTTTSGGRLIFQIFGAIAEFERSLIRERTMAGLTAARARGRKGGRPRSLDPQKVEVIKKLYEEKNLTVQQICDMFSITKPTMYDYIRGNHKQA